MSDILQKDSQLKPATESILVASAGSGKTTALTQRYVQFLLSDRIKNNALTNIVAMTFTNNAASEMRQRAMEILKKGCLGDRKTVEKLSDLVSLSEDEIIKKCENLVDQILDQYSDFRVQTIDSFLIRVFRSMALELGYSPEQKTVLEDDTLLDKVFEQFLVMASREETTRALLTNLTEKLILSRKRAKYLWNPYADLKGEVRSLFKKINKYPKLIEHQNWLEERGTIIEEIKKTILLLEEIAHHSGGEINHSFKEYARKVNEGEFEKLISSNIPKVILNKSGKNKKMADANELARPYLDSLSQLVEVYVILSAKSYYQPYIKAHLMIQEIIREVEKKERILPLDSANKLLGRSLNDEIVPELYYYLGERIYHFLIDEFQDTSPLQWSVLKPLIDNSLSQGGSLFVVGDMKQSIYGFRDADWRIMKDLLEKPVFPSAHRDIRELEVNYRSQERVLEFTKKVFHEIVPEKISSPAKSLSGLDSFKQNVREENLEKGYAEVQFFQEDLDQPPEKAHLIKTIKECQRRGFLLSEIAILTPMNVDVIAVSGWLNEAGINFISYSSLDIRSRKIIAEIIALLRFFNSPVDNLSFATVLLGDLLSQRATINDENISQDKFQIFLGTNYDPEDLRSPLYKKFRREYPELWDEIFEELFNVAGYLPLYDFVSNVFKVFRLFDLHGSEESALVKFLEVTRSFENESKTTLTDFLESVEEDTEDARWSLDPPTESEAVTIMTVHKAKGLGYRVVITLLYDHAPSRENMIIAEDADAITLYRSTKPMREKSPTLQSIADASNLRKDVDRLNQLYVSLTRAREELYVIGVYDTEKGQPTILIPESGFEEREKPPVQRKRDEALKNYISISHINEKLIEPVDGRRQIGIVETKRGDLIHKVLENIEYLESDVEGQINRIIEGCEDSDFSHLDRQEVKNAIIEFLMNDEAKTYFDKIHGCEIKREQEYLTADGKLHRLDRIIIDSGNITVVDFKTGGESEEHLDQLNTYEKILQESYPGSTIHGVLAYVDRKTIKRVH